MKAEIEKADQPTCDFCQRPRGDVFRFSFKNDEGRVMCSFLRCTACLSAIVMKVVALMPSAVLIHAALMHTPLVLMH